MKNFSFISNLDKTGVPLLMKPTGLFQRRVAHKGSLNENLQKKFFLDSYWIDDCFLSPDDFRRQLRREKRRVERSSVPLSIALFQLNEPDYDNKYELERFLDFLRTRTRETDIKGWVNSRTIGVILPATNEAGLSCYLDSIKKENGNSYLTVVKGTYPDFIFEKILEESEMVPN